MPTLESAVYAFEGLLPDLASPPIAARRALDHAGVRLSVEGWRSLPLDERQRITLAGIGDRVDVELVHGLLRRASPGPQRIPPVADPDPTAPPEALARALEPSRAIDPKRWARLRAVDRYALAHTYRRAVARSAFSILGEAFDAVLAANAPVYTTSRPPPNETPPGRPPAASYRPAGYYSTVTTPLETRETVRIPSHRPPSFGSVDAPPVPRSPIPPADLPPASRPRPAVMMMTATPPSDQPPPVEGRVAPLTPPPPLGALSNHLTQAGEVHMVDVARKPKTERRAVARGSVVMAPETLARIAAGDAPKGEVLATARIAGIMAAKRTAEIIPLCHPVAITHLEVLLELDAGASAVHVSAVVDAYDRTGCEMEAMVAVSAACLTLYDMLKGIDRGMVIADVRLMEKLGGRSGHFKRSEP